MNRNFRFVLLACMLAIPFVGRPQITGTITNARSGRPVEGVEVFLNGSTCFGKSDTQGQFQLDGSLPGFQEIVLYKKGYALYRSSIKIQKDRLYKLSLSLEPIGRHRPSKMTEEELEIVRNRLKGNQQDGVNITNLEEVQRNPGTPLMLENDTLGYRLYFYLKYPHDDLTVVPIRFEPMASMGIQQTIQRETSRKKHFIGSQRHWLISLTSNRLLEEGYRMADRGGLQLEGASLLDSSSLRYYKSLRIDQEISVLFGSDTSYLSLDGVGAISNSGALLNPRALKVRGAMSAKALAWQLPLDYSPIVGPVEEVYHRTFESLYEKIYVHTDKSYYYPGEPVWFKGYIHYKELHWRDSLSRVIYVELISPAETVLMDKTLKIDSGTFHNDFILPDTLQAGVYYLRAYTNLNRNFGDSLLFVRPIPVLGITEKLNHEITINKIQEESSGSLVIVPDKEVYHPRDKITLTIAPKNDYDVSVFADVSVSVTDMIQVVPVIDKQTILTGFPFARQDGKIESVADLKYPAEFGVSLKGRFFNDREKPEKTVLTVLQSGSYMARYTETDETGYFSVTGMDFYDSALFSVKADKARELRYGKVVLLNRDVAAMPRYWPNLNLPVVDTKVPQRIITDYEVPADARMLDNVEVKAVRIAEEYEKGYRLKRPYGKPDYVIEKKDIRPEYGNLLLSLQSRVPGLIVKQDEGGTWYVYTVRAEGSSANYKKEVIITVNDVFMGGPPAATLMTIDPNTVESIEVKLGVNVLYGSLGGNGIVSIYLKQGLENVPVVPNFLLLKAMGYSKSRVFSAPNHDQPENDSTMGDYRSTIYWNPRMRLGKGKSSLSFFAADLPGKYRVVVEGVLADDTPVREVVYLEIGER